ncbi:acetylcholine receptor subunit beta-type acr-3-like [Culicoides brevitarsis]|uniref:acetylcholine receptor subunit beta-type acr-3-like n=1 Tax=Culicoides brevitarsis TaxID=469753 RepID=UPI00307CBC8E
MTKLVIFSLFLTIFIEKAASLDCYGPAKSRAAQLRQFLLCDYEPLLPPVNRHTSTLVIENFRLDVRSYQFQERQGTLNLFTWMTMNWQDEHLHWDPANWDGIDRLQVTSDEVWLPDIYLEQSQSGSVMTTAPNIDCWVRQNGTVSCLVPIKLEVLCVADYRLWPHDSQECELNFLTWSYLAEQVDFAENLEFVASEVHEDMQWRITKTEVIGRWSSWWDIGQTNVGIKFKIGITRHAEEEDVVYLLPSIILSFMNLVTMLMKLDSKQRLILASINIAIQLMYNVQHVWSGTYHSDSVPMVYYYFHFSYLITILVIVETVLLSRVQKFELELPQTIDFSLKQFGTNKFAAIFLADINFSNEKVDSEGSWVIISKIFDRFLMILMVGTYFSIAQDLLPMKN